VVQTLTKISDTYYYPFSVLSFMVDSELYGMAPAGFHLTNVLLHTASVLLLFFLLRRMTGSLWRSALVAAMFAIHPIQVEAVAWVTARKDVLSGLFFMLTLHAYVSYVRHPFSLWRYGAVVMFFMAGLLSKPMLVTLPCVLLLLDFWPLERLFAGSKTRRVLLEKIPLLALSCVFSVVTCLATSPRSGAAVNIPSFIWRAGNASFSYIAYIRQMGFPVDLALPYPEYDLSAWGVSLSLFFLVFVSVIVFMLRGKRPFFLLGWLWYIGTLFPVSGMLRFLGTSRADRFTYLPQIGLYILVVWGIFELLLLWRHRCIILVGVSVMTLSALMVISRTQAAYWNDSQTLWSHTLTCTKNNYLAYGNLGVALFVKGDTAGAIDSFENSLRINPSCSPVWNNLAVAYAEEERWGEAVAAAGQALMLAEREENLELAAAIRSRREDYQQSFQALEK